MSLYRVGKQKGNTTGFAFEFWGVFCCAEPRVFGCLQRAAWAGKGRANVSLLHQTSPEKIHLWWKNLCRARGVSPSPASCCCCVKLRAVEVRFLAIPRRCGNIQLPSAPARHGRSGGMKEAKSCSRIPPVTGDALCSPASGAVSLGLRAMDLCFFFKINAGF